MHEFIILLLLCDPSRESCDKNTALQIKKIPVYTEALMLSPQECAAVVQKSLAEQGVVDGEEFRIFFRCGVKPAVNVAQNSYRD